MSIDQKSVERGHVVKKAWVTPSVEKLRAGDAENNTQTGASDGASAQRS